MTMCLTRCPWCQVARAASLAGPNSPRWRTLSKCFSFRNSTSFTLRARARGESRVRCHYFERYKRFQGELNNVNVVCLQIWKASRCSPNSWSRIGSRKYVHYDSQASLAHISFTHSILSFLFPSWIAVRSYRFHLQERDPIWGDNWSHSPFIRRSPSWGFPGFSSAVRQMPWDLCTAPGIFHYHPYHYWTT